MRTPVSYTLKVTVILVRPVVWRQIVVPSDITLQRLHAVIQITTGARDSIQHFFIDRRKTVYANPAWKNLPRIKSGRRVSLKKLLGRPGDRLTYYCGDDDEWEHEVELIKITTAGRRIARAYCVAGNRRCLERNEHRKGKFSLSVVSRALRVITV